MALNYGLEDKVALVTGGSRGIGLAMAKELLAQGSRVFICGRKTAGLDAAVAKLGDSERLAALPVHIGKSDQVDALFEAVIDRFGRLDLLINNVGMNLITGVTDADPGLWQKIIDTNLTGSFLCSRKAAQLMRTSNNGKIVSISSIAARRAAPAMGVYGIAKAGVEMLTRVLAQELAPFNIQVNAVAPCMVKTGFSQPFWDNAELLGEITRSIPLGRIAEPEDVVHPTLFLCSSGADFITGQTLMVDGGASAV